MSLSTFPIEEDGVRALTLFTILAFADASQAGRTVEILGTGSFHGDEVPADAPGPWFALVRQGNGATLRPVQVSVALERDEIGDEEGLMTGKRVDISPALEPIVLVRGVPGLKEGPLPTVLVEKAINLGRDLRAQLRGRSYQLSLRCAERAAEGQRQEQCDLKLRSGTREQVLFTYGAYFAEGQRIFAADHIPEVHWAGDLDGDGRLDILLDTSDHYNVREMRLYLSSRAKGGALVAESMPFTSTGC